MDDKCRIFAPAKAKDRTKKRGKPGTAHPERASQLRKQTYHESWRKLEPALQAVLTESYSPAAEQVQEFLSHKAASFRERNVIPTILLARGPILTSRAGFLQVCGERAGDQSDCLLVNLRSGACPNLKAILREVTRGAGSTSQNDGTDDKNGGPKLFEYDLELLRQQYTRKRTKHVIVSFEDCEAFDTGALVQAIDIFHSWLDRIPFVLVFGLGTSSASFQARLPASTLRILKGEEVSLEDTSNTVEATLACFMDAPQSALFLGPDLVSRLIRNQYEHVQSHERMVGAIKYAYMAHFYANNLSLFLHAGIKYKEVPGAVFEGIRNLPSYRQWAERRLNEGDTESVRASLESEDALFNIVTESLTTTATSIKEITVATNLVYVLREALQPTATPISRSALYVQAMSAGFSNSPLIRELQLAVRKAPSDSLDEAFQHLSQAGISREQFDLEEYAAMLGAITKKQPEANGPLRSQHDSRNDNFKTTIIGQKVQLSKQQKSVSGLHAEYSQLVENFHQALAAYFAASFVDHKQLFLHELLVYDLKSPHTDVFQPRPRFAIERALFSPHDYLGCDCCPSNSSRHSDVENTLAPSQPPASILYQLYLESGSLINVADLWSAFHAIIGQPDEDEDDEVARYKTLFQRSLAELKYLGMIRPTKKKTDHIAKAMWHGL